MNINISSKNMSNKITPCWEVNSLLAFPSLLQKIIFILVILQEEQLFFQKNNCTSCENLLVIFTKRNFTKSSPCHFYKEFFFDQIIYFSLSCSHFHKEKIIFFNLSNKRFFSGTKKQPYFTATPA